MDLALALAADKAGSSMAARIAMMAMTTSNSTKVKARFVFTFYQTIKRELSYEKRFVSSSNIPDATHDLFFLQTRLQPARHT